MRLNNVTARFADLLAAHAPPCVSLYLPIARAAPPAGENPIRFSAMLQRTRELLSDRYDEQQSRAVLDRLEGLPRRMFGTGPDDGMAIFAAPEFIRVIYLQSQVNEQIVVADSFHIKPLIRAGQFDGRFAVLCFSLHDVRLFEGDRHAIKQVSLPNVPRSIQQASTEQSRQAGAAYPAEQGRAVATISAEQFMRLVDQRVFENYSRDNHLPLLLFADPQHHGDFLALAKNQFLEDGLALNPDPLSPQRIHDEAWKRIEPRYREEIARMGEQFRAAKARQMGTDALPQVAEAAALGRIGTLLVDADHHIPGVLHRATGFVEQGGGKFDHRSEDVLDDLAEVVMQRDGQVFVLPHEQMPTDTGVAAVFRY